MTVAFLHLAPELGTLDRNRSLIEDGTRVAADSGADWVLSGELVVPGCRFESLIGTDWIAEQPDSWMRRLARLSSDLGVVSFVSHPERETLTGKLFNSLFVIGCNGRMLGRQRKLKPTPQLRSAYVAFNGYGPLLWLLVVGSLLAALSAWLAHERFATY